MAPFHRLLAGLVLFASSFMLSGSARAECVIRGESVGHPRLRPVGLRADLSIRAVPASITLRSRMAERVDLRVEGELAFVAPVRLAELRAGVSGVTRAAALVSVSGDSARVRWTNDDGTRTERDVLCAELELVGHAEPPIDDRGCLVERAVHGGRFVEVVHAVMRSGASVYGRPGRGRWATAATGESIRVLDLPGQEWLPIMNVPGLGGLSDLRGTSSHGWIRRTDLTMGVMAERGLTLIEATDGLRVGAAEGVWHGFGLRVDDVITRVVDVARPDRATQFGALTLGQREWRVPGTRIAYIRDLIGRGEAVVHVSRATRDETITIPAAPAAQEPCSRMRRGCAHELRLW